MKKIIPLSLFAFASLYAADVVLAPINVESTVISDVAQNAQTSADTATALSNSVPSIDMSRRSGIANDIIIRGQKRDNISMEVDGTKVYGACPNRMDPPISHIVAHQITDIKVIEGPYDVEDMGTLSGGVKIKTKQATKKTKVEANLGFGAWNYKKFGLTGSGGNDFIRMLLTVSTESSEQYRDGEGHTFADQLKLKAPAGNQLQTRYEDMQAYEKKSFLAKAFVTTAENQELRLSYTGNRSDSVLYPNSPMDALSDDSNIYSVAYNVDALSDTYKNLNIQYYYSDVDHPMSTGYRKAAAINPTKNITSHLWTTMQGVKIKNSFDIENHKLLVGVDASQRRWDGEYSNNVSGRILGDSIDNALTKNIALFATLEKDYGNFNIKTGLRFDSTKISDDDVAHQDNSYKGINANIFTTFHLNDENKLFAGLGQASRVPDGRELYFQKNHHTLGTPSLDQTTNREVDFGYKLSSDTVEFKIKGFYSKLKNYIYFQKQANGVNLTAHNFKNIDATVYGAEMSASVYVTDDISVDMGASYKRGKKDEALLGQTDRDMADMAPLRGNIALNYEYMNNSMLTAKVLSSAKWKNFDRDNGEQALDSWTVLNLKLKHAINRKFDFTLGLNNAFNRTYIQSNSYADLTLVSAGGTQSMLLNEPGRYFYTNLDFKF